MLAMYYVNDGSTASDEWCTMSGNDANDGLTAATPKATVQAVLSDYDLGPGDTVRIDTGTYTLTNNILVATSDAGDASSPVIFEASPHGVTFNRNNIDEGCFAWAITGSYVDLTTATCSAHSSLPQTWMKITGGFNGMVVAGDYVHVSRCDVVANSSVGIGVQTDNAPYIAHHVMIENCIARGQVSGIGILAARTEYLTVKNCTIYGNGKYGMEYYSSSFVSALNNIICANGPGAYGVYLDAGSTLSSSDYNDLHVTDGAYLGYSSGDFATLADWQAAMGQDSHSLSSDPMFASAAAGDFHERSTQGRYDSSLGLSPQNSDSWVRDVAESPCIDAGNPGSSFVDEPAANGGRVNMGAYGNTEQASRSGCSLDADGNGVADALTDGILILRYLFDPAGAWNYADALGTGATRTIRSAIRSFLDNGRTDMLDVDANGTPDALTDGILILRYLFAPNSEWNYADALGTGATRTTRAQIKAFLDQYNPALSPPPDAVIATVNIATSNNFASFATSVPAVANQSECPTDDAGLPALVSNTLEIDSGMTGRLHGVQVVTGTSTDNRPAAATAPASLVTGVGRDTLRPSAGLNLLTVDWGSGVRASEAGDCVFVSGAYDDEAKNLVGQRDMDLILRQWNQPMALIEGSLQDDQGSLNELFSDCGQDWPLTSGRVVSALRSGTVYGP